MDKRPGGMVPGAFNRREDLKRLKESVAGTKTGLPPKLLQYFAPRAPLNVGKITSKKAPALPYMGVGHYVDFFSVPGDAEYEPEPPTLRPPSPRLFKNKELAIQVRLDTETRAEKRLRIAKWLEDEAERECKEKAKGWDPTKDMKVIGDPYKTLFIGRLSYDVNEKKLRKEFEEFGPIRTIRIVQDKTSGKPRGYAFIEYEHKKDMKDAYKMSDGRKIEGRRIVVDVERGRTVDNWKPRRLGGGLGGEGRLPKEPKKKGAAAEEPRRDFRSDRGPARDRSPMRDRERSPVRKERARSPARERKRERSASPRRAAAIEDNKSRRYEAPRAEAGRRRERDVL